MGAPQVTLTDSTVDVTIDDSTVTLEIIDNEVTVDFVDGINAISQATDTSLSGLATGDLLVYNSTTGKWENKTESSVGHLELDGSTTMTGAIVSDVGTFTSNVATGIGAIAFTFNSLNDITNVDSSLVMFSNGGENLLSLDAPINGKTVIMNHNAIPAAYTRFDSKSSTAIYEFSDSANDIAFYPAAGQFLVSNSKGAFGVGYGGSAEYSFEFDSTGLFSPSFLNRDIGTVGVANRFRDLYLNGDVNAESGNVSCVDVDVSGDINLATLSDINLGFVSRFYKVGSFSTFTFLDDSASLAIVAGTGGVNITNTLGLTNFSVTNSISSDIVGFGLTTSTMSFYPTIAGTSIGSVSNPWDSFFNSGTYNTSSGLFESSVAFGGTGVGYVFDTTNILTTTGDTLFDFQQNGNTRFKFHITDIGSAIQTSILEFTGYGSLGIYDGVLFKGIGTASVWAFEDTAGGRISFDQKKLTTSHSAITFGTSDGSVLIIEEANFRPAFSSTTDLGSVGASYKDIYLGGTINTSSGLFESSVVTSNGGDSLFGFDTVNATGVAQDLFSVTEQGTVKFRIDTTGCTRTTNQLVVNDKSYNSGYEVSIQSSNTQSWLEILNSGGSGKGAFFGLDTNNFEIWNYQGGDINFYTDAVASNGTLALTLDTNQDATFTADIACVDANLSGDLDVAGHVEIGSLATPATSTTVVIDEGYASPTVGTLGVQVISRLSGSSTLEQSAQEFSIQASGTTHSLISAARFAPLAVSGTVALGKGGLGRVVTAGGTFTEAHSFESDCLIAGGTVVTYYGYYAVNPTIIVGTAPVTTAAAWFEKQTEGTGNNYGLVLDGDDLGADICFGASQDVRQHFNGTVLEFEGSGIAHTATPVTNDGYVQIAINGVTHKFMTGT